MDSNDIQGSLNEAARRRIVMDRPIRRGQRWFEGQSIERDEKGQFIYLKPHLRDLIPLGVSAPRPGQIALFKESVVETLTDIWRQNGEYVCDMLPEFPYCGLYLDLDQPCIGGFSTKDRRDEAKGSLIEEINSSLIIAMVTPGLLQHHAFVIVPTVQTLASMGEFTMLVDADYEFCFVDDEGCVQLTDMPVSYEAITEMTVKDGIVQEALVTALLAENDIPLPESAFEDLHEDVSVKEEMKPVVLEDSHVEGNALPDNMGNAVDEDIVDSDAEELVNEDDMEPDFNEDEPDFGEGEPPEDLWGNEFPPDDE